MVCRVGSGESEAVVQKLIVTMKLTMTRSQTSREPSAQPASYLSTLDGLFQLGGAYLLSKCV